MKMQDTIISSQKCLIYKYVLKYFICLTNSRILTDLSGRGNKKFGDDCSVDKECSFAGSYCEPKKKKCACKEEFEATNHIDKCGHGELVCFLAFYTWCFFTIVYIKYENLQGESQFIGRKLKWLLFHGIEVAFLFYGIFKLQCYKTVSCINIIINNTWLFERN